MNNISKKRVNQIIGRYILEVCLLIVFMIVSYVAFTSTNLSTSALVAEKYSEEKRDLQVLYGRTETNMEEVLTYETLMDRGELNIKNPNQNAISMEIVMIIDNAQNIDLNYYMIDIGDKIVDLNSAVEKEGKYEITLDTVALKGYGNYQNTISIYGDALSNKRLDYTFKVIESFYN